MKHWFFGTLFALTIWGMEAGAAYAQIGTYIRPQYNSRPTMSPYLNIVTGGNPVTSYYGLVRPQMQASQNFLQLQQEYQNLQGSLSTMGTGNFFMPQTNTNNQTYVPMTGHPTMFMNFGGFYPSFGGNGGSGSITGMGTGSFPTGTSGIYRR